MGNLGEGYTEASSIILVALLKVLNLQRNFRLDEARRSCSVSTEIKGNSGEWAEMESLIISD